MHLLDIASVLILVVLRVHHAVMRQVTETSRRKVRSAATFKSRNGISLTALKEEGNEEQSHLLRILLAVSEFDH